MADRQVDVGHPEPVRPAPRRCRSPRRTAARRRSSRPPRRPSAGRQARRGPWPAPPWRRTARPATRGERRLGRGEQALPQTGRTGQGLLEALDVHDVHADPHDHLVRLGRRVKGKGAATRVRALASESSDLRDAGRWYATSAGKVPDLTADIAHFPRTRRPGPRVAANGAIERRRSPRSMPLGSKGLSPANVENAPPTADGQRPDPPCCALDRDRSTSGVSRRRRRRTRPPWRAPQRGRRA